MLFVLREKLQEYLELCVVHRFDDKLFVVREKEKATRCTCSFSSTISLFFFGSRESIKVSSVMPFAS